MKTAARLAIAALLGTLPFATGHSLAQDAPVFTPHFPASEFASRHTAVYDAIGPGAVAVVQGAAVPQGYTPFRQTNEFFYLSGIETPHAYLVLDGTHRSSAVFLPHRDERRESSEGKLLSAEDADIVREVAGFDAVFGVEALEGHLQELLAGSDGDLAILTPFAPAEGAAMSRDLAARHNADVAADPWDGSRSREENFAGLLRQRLPGAAVGDLSPVLDELRLIKSPREIAMIRRATHISMAAILEAMRSVAPDVMEYEIDALARFVFLRHGAQGLAYYSLVGAGPNAWYPHYHAGGRRMEDGDFLLVDVGPDVGYYSTDVTRMMPTNGVFNEWQRELYGFYLDCYRAILDSIRPGEVADILRDAAAGMQQALDSREFSKPEYEAAAQAFVGRYVQQASRGTGSLGHWVGMAVHDVGPRDGTLRPGMVFTIEPQFRVPEERIYIRLEDMILITETGMELISRDLPMDIAEIEAMMQEEGLLQRYPALLPPMPGDPLESQRAPGR